MGTLNFCLGLGNLGSGGVFLHPFVIGNHDYFLFLEWVGKLYLTIFGWKSQDYYENGKSQHLVHISIVLFFFFFHALITRLMKLDFLQLLIVPTWKISIATGSMLPLLTLVKLRILTIL